MTFIVDTAAKAAFKRLYGKAHTSNAKDIGNESEASGLSLVAQRIFASTIPSTGAAAVSGGIAAFVSIPLVLDPSSGGKSYFAKITGSVPAGLVGETNPLTGTVYATGQRVGTFIPDYLGSDFRIILKDGVTEIPPLASQDWFFDYYAGIVTSEDNLSLSSGTVEGYIYTGVMLSATTSPWTSAGVDIYNINTGSVLVQNDLGIAGNGYAELKFGIGTTDPTDPINSDSKLLIKYGDLVIDDDSGANVPSIDLRGNETLASNVVGHLAFGNSQSAASLRRIATIDGLTGDPYDAEAGQLAFTTADTAGSLTERMRIDEDGHIGLGTSSPATLLHLSAPSSATIGTTQGAILRLDYNDTSWIVGDVLGAVEWYGNDASSGASGVRARIQSVAGSTTGATTLQFYTTNSSSTTLNHVMSIDYNQRIGVGTDLPDTKLHIMLSDASATSNANAIATFERSGTGYLQLLTPDANENGILFGLTSNSASGSIIYNNSSNTEGIQFRTGGNSTRAVITSSGDIGAGTLTPDSKLHIMVSDASATSSASAIATFERSGTGYLQLLTPDANENGILFGLTSDNSSGGIIYNNSLNSDGMQFRTGGNATRAVITSSGDIGIGTTAPDAKLHVMRTDASATSNASAIATFERSGTGYLQLLTPDINANGILFGLASNNSSGGIIYNDTVSQGFKFNTGGGTTRMVITSGGNVGIGTSGPSTALDVSGTTRSTSLITTGGEVHFDLDGTADEKINYNSGTNTFEFYDGTLTPEADIEAGNYYYGSEREGEVRFRIDPVFVQNAASATFTTPDGTDELIGYSATISASFDSQIGFWLPPPISNASLYQLHGRIKVFCTGTIDLEVRAYACWANNTEWDRGGLDFGGVHTTPIRDENIFATVNNGDILSILFTWGTGIESYSGNKIEGVLLTIGASGSMGTVVMYPYNFKATYKSTRSGLFDV
jgi:hypothetical protein